ncbi:hypothetical protein [Streptomyces sp. NPDC046887]|uniref:hypothetical protein n=1 Tax=Streptomyces sp. NPDC046887 TaxID=3155472 RepID=UPI0033C73798
MAATACSLSLTVGLLLPADHVSSTDLSDTALAAAASCPSAVPTYLVAQEGIHGSTITRYVDWDPSGSGHLFNAEKTATLSRGQRLFSGGGTRLFVTNGWLGGSLTSYQDQTDKGGSLLSLEYVYEKRAGQNWRADTRIWVDADGRVVNFDEAGNLNVYVEQFPDGTRTSARMSRLAQLPADDAALVELRRSQSIWSAGDEIYGLRDGEIRSWKYQASLNKIVLGPQVVGAVVIKGLTDAADAWSPAPGVFYVKTAEGAVRKYAGSPAALVNEDVAVGLSGTVLAGAARCLSSAGDEKPYFGAPVEDAGVPSVPDRPAQPVQEAGPEVVSGRFLLPNGNPATGMQVVVEAADLLPADGSSTDLPDLGTATTDADGEWSLTLPAKLPTEVQAVVDGNGGALNVTATTVATTETGVTLIGASNMTAAPKSPRTGARTAFASAASEEPTPAAELLPIGQGGGTVGDPTAQEVKSTHAARVAAAPQYDAESQQAPRWQSDRTSSAASYNPYVVDGVDIRNQQVTPRADTCWMESRVVSRQISYTISGESHSYWDAAGYVEYTSKLSNTVDVGLSMSGSAWKVSGSTSIGSSAAGVSGFSWRGPYFAKQWKVPIEYNKIRKVRKCGGIEMNDPYYEIRPSKFKVPAGGSPGVFGKDARQLDGPLRYAKSNPKYRAYLIPMSTWGLDVGKSVKYSGAAEVFGVSLGGSVQYDGNHKQLIRAGGRTARKHYIWGNSAPPGAHMGVIYSN